MKTAMCLKNWDKYILLRDELYKYYLLRYFEKITLKGR